MSYNTPTMGSGSRASGRAFEFGRTHVVRPKGKHQATIVWLHGLGDNGSRYIPCYPFRCFYHPRYDVTLLLKLDIGFLIIV
ncbi:lysophospholipase [Ranunculus cassubicifolius]